jgi:hypothetical protein
MGLFWWADRVNGELRDSICSTLNPALTDKTVHLQIERTELKYWL